MGPVHIVRKQRGRVLLIMAFSMCLGGLLGHMCTPLPNLCAHGSIHKCTHTHVHTHISAILKIHSFPPNMPHCLLSTGLSLYQNTPSPHLPGCLLVPLHASSDQESVTPLRTFVSSAVPALQWEQVLPCFVLPP